jgi:hypothetical protein
MTRDISTPTNGQPDGSDGLPRTTDEPWYQSLWQTVKPGAIAAATASFLMWLAFMVINL